MCVHYFSLPRPLPNNTSIRTINVEIFDEKSLTDDLRVAFAKINVPERVFQV